MRIGPQVHGLTGRPSTGAEVPAYAPLMQASVIGGSGLVGRSLVQLLLREAAVERVVNIARRPSLPAHPKFEERVLDFEELATALGNYPVTHAFCCLGTTIGVAGSKEAFRHVDFDYPLAFARAARAAGAHSFLLVSAAGANASSLFFYNRVKGELEAALRDVSFPALHLLRPSLLLGERAEKRTGERVAAALARPLQGLLGGPLAKYAPIAASDVARALVTLSLRATPGVFVHESDELARIAADSPRTARE